jgi:hypothetical protein
MKPVDGETNKHRIRIGPFASRERDGNNGLFQFYRGGYILNVMVSDGLGWEHVSVSRLGETRCPSWEDMCFAKDLFWGEEEVVVQYHPAKADYVNMHPYTLHLWKPTGVDIPTPPPIMVGLGRKK